LATDAGSPLRAMTGSFKTVSSTAANRPSTTTYPLGTFKQDWEYVAGSG
jgi:YHYH protein